MDNNERIEQAILVKTKGTKYFKVPALFKFIETKINFEIICFRSRNLNWLLNNIKELFNI